MKFKKGDRVMINYYSDKRETGWKYGTVLKPTRKNKKSGELVLTVRWDSTGHLFTGSQVGIEFAGMFDGASN